MAAMSAPVRVRPVAASAPDRPSASGFVIVIVAASLFGTLGPLSRFAYDAGMEPLPFVVWRGLVGLIATSIFVAWRIRGGHMHLTHWGDLDRGARLSLGVAALMGFTLNLAMFISFDLVTIALALLGFYTYPVIVAVVNVALGRETLDSWFTAPLFVIAAAVLIRFSPNSAWLVLAGVGAGLLHAWLL